jgi:hypothetical protein
MVGTVPGIEGETTAQAAIDEPDASALPARLVRPGPALIVLGIAVVIVVVGLVGSAIVTNTTGKASPTGIHHVTLPDGTSISLTPGATALHSMVSEGQPPADILDNLAVPSGSRATGTVNNAQAAGQYDQTVSFATSQAGEGVIDTYKTLLPKLGWQVIYDGPGLGHESSGTEVLAKRGSADGYDWEVGVVVSPTTAAGTTPFSVEVFELSDDN